jgi:hypothetical protein
LESSEGRTTAKNGRLKMHWSRYNVLQKVIKMSE